MYQLNPKLARQGDVRSGKYISEIGKYKGVFTIAEKVVSNEKGTHGVRFTFRSDEEQLANFDIWTKSASGEEYFGLNQLNALMTCMRIKSIQPAEGIIKRWDSIAKQEVPYTGQIFSDLMNKPIGILFETEDFEKKDGAILTKVAFAGCFEAGSELIATEILDKAIHPERLSHLVSLLKHRPLKKKKGPAAPTDNGFSVPDYFNDDDIPL